MSQVAPAPRRSPVAAFFVGLWDVANFTRKLVLNLIFFGLLFLVFIFFIIAAGSGGVKPLMERTTFVLAPEGRLVEQFTADPATRALAKALGDKRGISRYGSVYSPMDETLSRVALDISGRPWLVCKLPFTVTKIGEWDTEMVEHFFHSLAQAAGITLHIELLYGSNNHHIVESAFKGLARALRQAVEIDPRKADAIPSTKGML